MKKIKKKQREIVSPLLMEREAAKYLRINSGTMHDLYKYGFLRPLSLGARKFPIYELDEFIRKWTESDESLEDALDKARKKDANDSNVEEKLIHI